MRSASRSDGRGGVEESNLEWLPGPSSSLLYPSCVKRIEGLVVKLLRFHDLADGPDRGKIAALPLNALLPNTGLHTIGDCRMYLSSKLG